MVVRQRLRAIVDLRKAQYVCWACLSQAQSSSSAAENLALKSLTLKEPRSTSSKRPRTRSYKQKNLAEYGDISKDGGPPNGVHVSKTFVKNKIASPNRRNRKTGSPRRPSLIGWVDHGEQYATTSGQAACASGFIAPVRKQRGPWQRKLRAPQSTTVTRQYSTTPRSGRMDQKMMTSFIIPAQRALHTQNSSLLPSQNFRGQSCIEKTHPDRGVKSMLESARKGVIETRASPRAIARMYGSKLYSEADDSPHQENMPLHKEGQETCRTFDQPRDPPGFGQCKLRHARWLLPSANNSLGAHLFSKKRLYKLRQDLRHVQARLLSSVSDAQTLRTNEDEVQDVGTSKQRPESITTHLLRWREIHEAQIKKNVEQRSSDFVGPFSGTSDFSAPFGINYQKSIETTDDDFEDRDPTQDLEADDAVVFDQPTEDFGSSHSVLAAGDLVDFVQYAETESRFGVVVRRLGSDLLVLSDRGEWKHTKSSKVKYVIPRFLSASLSRRLQQFGPSVQEMLNSREQSLAALARTKPPVPRDAIREIMLRIAKFGEAASLVYRNHAANLDRALQLIGNEGGPPDARRDLQVIARRLLGKSPNSPLSPVELFVVNRTLGDSEYISFRRTYHYLKSELSFASTSTVDTMSTVKEWVRQYQEALVSNNQASYGIETIDASATESPLGTFVEKARAIILRSREFRPLSTIGTIGPAFLKKEQSSSAREDFNEEEMKIINFLRDWVWTKSQTVGKSAAFAGSMIIRAIGLYDGQPSDRFGAWTMLKELNVVHPWEPLPSKYGSVEVPDLDSTNAMALSRDRAWETVVNAELKDSMSHLRKDWGDLAVFCIDGEATLERDDGISLESIAQEPDNVWLHVHIANPTAFISPGSSIAKYFGEHGETCYFPHQRSPLLPPDLVQDRLSLASNRPCITFSAKVSSDGDLLEHKITNGIVRNVYFLTPEQAEGLLNESADSESQQPAPLLQIGGTAEKVQPLKPVRSPESLRPLGEEEIATLRRLSGFTKAHCTKRSENLMIDRDVAVNQDGCLASVTFPPYNNAQGAQAVSQHDCDPLIVIRPANRSRDTMISQAIMESMLIAGQICASWCKERKIPIPYRGHIQNAQPLMSPDAFRKAYFEPFVQQHSPGSQIEPEPTTLLQYVRLQKTYGALLGSLSLGPNPLKHLTLGIPVYCKATSPLRRYADMLAHWQVEAVLRYEHTIKTSLADVDPACLPHEPKLPFSKQQIAQASRDLHLRENDIRQAQNAMRRFWVLQALHHAFYFDRAQLPKTFEASVRSSDRLGVYARVQGWDIDAWIDETPVSREAGGFRLNDRWEVELRRVDTNDDRVDCVPVRLIWREDSAANAVAKMRADAVAATAVAASTAPRAPQDLSASERG